MFESVRLPHDRLVEPFSAVFLPIVALRTVLELVGKDRIASVEHPAQLFEDHPRQFVRLDGKLKQRKERDELVMRNQSFDPAQEARSCRAHSVLVEARFRMESDAFLLPDGFILGPAVMR